MMVLASKVPMSSGVSLLSQLADGTGTLVPLIFFTNGCYEEHNTLHFHEDLELYSMDVLQKGGKRLVHAISWRTNIRSM
jgi:hypothetical protein